MRATLALLLVLVAETARGQSLAERWDAARKDGTYRAPAHEELDAAERLFARTFAVKRNDVADLQAAWARAGLELTTITDKGQQLLALSEPAGEKRGRGFYAFRPG